MVVIPIKSIFKFTLYYYKQFTSAPFISKAFSCSPLADKLVTKKGKSSYTVVFDGRF